MLGILGWALQLALSPRPDASPLPRFGTVPRCPHDDDDGDVVVCGSVDQSRFRLRPRPDRYHHDDAALPRAEVPLGGGTLGVTAQQGNVGGVSGNRAMLTWKLKF